MPKGSSACPWFADGGAIVSRPTGLPGGASPAGAVGGGVHYQGHGKSPRLGSQLHWANAVANAADAVDWAATHLGGPVVPLGSSQGGILAMAVAARTRQLALVVAHNVLDPMLPESLTITRLPRRLMVAYRPLLSALRLAYRCRSGPTWTWTGSAASPRPVGGS